MWKSNRNCAWNLTFPEFISPIVWNNMCEHLHIMKSVCFKELHNEQEYYSSTIYRAGAAECQLLLVVYIVIVYCYCYCVSHNLELILGHPALPLNNNVPRKSRVALLSSIWRRIRNRAPSYFLDYIILTCANKITTL